MICFPKEAKDLPTEDLEKIVKECQAEIDRRKQTCPASERENHRPIPDYVLLDIN